LEDPTKFPEIRKFLNPPGNERESDEGSEDSEEGEDYGTGDEGAPDVSTSDSPPPPPGLLNNLIDSAVSILSRGKKSSGKEEVDKPEVQSGTSIFKSPLHGKPNPFISTPSRSESLETSIPSIGKQRSHSTTKVGKKK